MATIGFIGLGHMGLPMATNLINAEHKVIGYDINEGALDALSSAGGEATTSLDAMDGDLDIVITMLQKGEQVEATYLGEKGLFNTTREDALCIDCSSINIQSTHQLHQAAKDCGTAFIDAPVSGGVAGAHAGTLTFMVGGDIALFEQARPLFEVMGKTIIHAGDGGSGQAAKICNNTLLAISMIGVSEVFTLAEKLNLDSKTLHHIITHASGHCWVTDNYMPVPGVLDNVPADHNYEPGFTSTMMLKDLKSSEAAAKYTNLQLPLSQEATALYEAFIEQGNGDLDCSAIIKMLES